MNILNNIKDFKSRVEEECSRREASCNEGFIDVNDIDSKEIPQNTPNKKVDFGVKKKKNIEGISIPCDTCRIQELCKNAHTIKISIPKGELCFFTGEIQCSRYIE